MGQIKVVLIFNEDDERQREAGEYLKTKKRLDDLIDEAEKLIDRMRCATYE